MEFLKEVIANQAIENAELKKQIKSIEDYKNMWLKEYVQEKEKREALEAQMEKTEVFANV